jgi:nitrile hydratase
MVVCTLCSCYPWPVLGLPPVWYKSAPYRSRAVSDPRGVLQDFGLALAPDTEIRVWDSTAETRFIVVPMRPAGTQDWSEERLAALVTRDCMVGTGLPKAPGEDPQWLYAVVFEGRELWGEDGDPNLCVSIEAFEPYLEAA